MTNTTRLLATVSAFAIASFGAIPAFAAGTASGSNITNTATINYQVGGVNQTPQAASNTFVVDRKILMTLTGGAQTSAGPGQTGAATTYTLTNNSNATLDFALSLAQQATGATTAHGVDGFDTTGGAFYINNNPANLTFDPTNSKVVTYIDELAPDTSQTVFFVSNVPITQRNGDVSGQIVTAIAHEGNTPNAQGALVTQTAGANTVGIDTVFADATSTGAATNAGDVARDGKFSAANDYIVSAPVLTVTKTATVVSDPINLTTNPKNIPFATVGYCITVANAGGGAAATNVVVSDPLPAQTTYDPAFGVYTNGTGTCTSDGSTVKTTPAAGITTVSGTIASIPAGSTRSLYFQVTIN